MNLKLPEHEKLKAIQPKSQAIGEFLEWAGEQGMALASYGDERGDRETLFHVSRSKENLLAEFFEIDLKKLEAEKEAILAEQRTLNERSGRS